MKFSRVGQIIGILESTTEIYTCSFSFPEPNKLLKHRSSRTTVLLTLPNQHYRYIILGVYSCYTTSLYTAIFSAYSTRRAPQSKSAYHLRPIESPMITLHSKSSTHSAGSSEQERKKTWSPSHWHHRYYHHPVSFGCLGHRVRIGSAKTSRDHTIGVYSQYCNDYYNFFSIFNQFNNI